MHDAGTSNTNTSQQPYCPDRRTALKAFALAAGGVALNSSRPLLGEARSASQERFRILYRLRGGYHPDKQVKYVKRGKVLSTSKLKKPKRRGYTFAGWYSDLRLKKKASRIYGKARLTTRTVYAKWRLKRYAITYNLNGGVAPSNPRTSYTIESKSIVFKEPTKFGYRFMGWYADPEFTKSKPSIMAGSTGDVEVHARWELANYQIEYELDGGEETVALPKSYTMYSPEIKPFTPAKEGARFAGWYTDSELQNHFHSIPTGSTGDVKLYADWVSADYWDEHLQAKCDSINEIAEGIANGLPGLVFITDMHLPTNAMLSPGFVRRVMASTNTNMVVFGGDVINEQISKNEANLFLNYVRKAFGDVEVHLVRGNHDGNCQSAGANLDEKVTDAEFLGIARHESETRDGECIYCYRDDEERKVRFIFLDSKEPDTCSVDEQQLLWMKDRVLELEEGWTVLVFVHQFFRGLTTVEGVKVATYTTSGMLVKTALDSIHDETRAAIAGVVSGHIHSDYAEYSDKGYPLICTKCDAYGNGRPDLDYSYKLGTIAEQAFDVITLDTEQKMLYFTRVGSGEDRSFSFAPPSSSEEYLQE